MQRVFFLWGRSRSGKGTIMRVLVQLLGRRNIASPTIQGLGTPFGKQDLLGKTAAFITDMNCDNTRDLAEAATLINQISGEDSVSVQRKYKEAVTVQLPARFLMASNSLPNFGSHTLAMSTRLVTLPFDVSFEGREDFELDAKLAAELPGILNWALDGLDDLRLSGRFANPPASEEAKRQLLRRSNILQSFVEEHCDIAPSHEIDKAVFRKAYTAFCYDADARPSPENKLTEEMRLLFAGTKASRRRVGADKQIPTYAGIRLKGEHALRYFEHDPEMLALGCTPYEALTLDAHGAPVPRKVCAEFSE